MFLQYQYLKKKIDNEAELDTLPKNCIKWVSKEELAQHCGDIFADVIWKFNTKYEKLPFVIIPNDTKFEIHCLFTEKEYEIIKQECSDFAEILYKFADRLAVDDTNTLYDLDENKTDTYTWYSYYLAI